MDNNNSVQPRANAEQSGAGSLLKVLEFTAAKAIQLADANSILGERIEVGGMTIIPVSKMSVGFAGGGADVTDVGRKKKQNPVGAGAKVTLTPVTFLVINEGEASLIEITLPDKKSGTAEAINAIADQIRSAVASAKEAKKNKSGKK